MRRPLSGRCARSPSIRPHPRLALAAAAVLWFAAIASAPAEVGGIAPRRLLDPGSPDAAKHVRPTDDGLATVTCGRDGVQIALRGGAADYPGVRIVPGEGSAWDLSPYGRIEAAITNTGSAAVSVALRVDNAGDWSKSPWSTEQATLAPGERRVVKVLFGRSYGYQPSTKLDPAAISQVLLFLGKSAEPRSLRLEDLQASGSAGEAPPADPAAQRIVPRDGVLFAVGAAPDAAPKLEPSGAARAAFADGAIALDFAGGAPGEARIAAPAGTWRLDAWLRVRVHVRNLGAAPAAPRFRLDGKDGAGDVIAAPAIAPGGEADVALPFAPAVAARIATDPRQLVFGPGAWNEQNWGPEPGTGTGFASGWAKGVAVLGDGTAMRLRIDRIVADVPPDDAPAWLGTRPPVAGDWTPTLAEEFDAPTLDPARWNIAAHNYWDKRTHFSRDEVALRDGCLVLRYEHKRGPHNDDPADTETGTTDYAAGYADTYGTWTQRYGYFEARVKLPRAPGLWPAFWLMPDRGVAAGPQWRRQDTGDAGMEFDILEFLSAWGPYRYNLACHWDGYGKEHKSCGSVINYVRPDDDGFITTGLLWTPGVAAFYAQGRELLRWESPRVSTRASNVILTFVSGGWDNEPLDDARLPDEFVIDYVRAWQRKDLASPVDGVKPAAAR